MYTEYTTISGYLESKTDLAARIVVLNAAILASENMLLDLATGVGAGIAYYELDDDQVRIKTGYRSVADVMTGIDALERRKNKLINQLNGRGSVLQDRSTFQGPGRFF